MDIDFQDFIKTTPIKLFRRLENKNIFKKFILDYTIKWDDELDIAPEYLYYEAFKNDENLKEQLKNGDIYRTDELYSTTDIVKNFSSIAAKLSKHEIEKIGILKNNRLDFVMLRSNALRGYDQKRGAKGVF